VTDSAAPGDDPDAALAAVLAGADGAMVAAVTPDGFRIALPDGLDIGDSRPVPLPVERETMLEFIAPSDHFMAIEAWVEARTAGQGTVRVRTRRDPERTVVLTFVDARRTRGILFAVASEPGATPDEPADDDSAVVQAARAVPQRPRTATVWKTWEALITGIDARATRMLGWTAEQMVGTWSADFVHRRDQSRALASWMEMLATKGSQRVRVRHRCADGSFLWVELENTYRPGDQPENATVVTQISDISDEMAAHAALDRQARLLRQLTESLPIGLLQVGADGELAYANKRLAEIVGVRDATTVADQLRTVAAADRSRLMAALRSAVDTTADRDLEVDVAVPGTGWRRCAVAVVAVTDQDGDPGGIACVTDITESARMRDELRARATYDALTGCLNRSSVIAELDRALAAPASRTGVLFLDLNDFKSVNDTYGHAAGDRLLVHAAACLTGSAGPGDAVGRLGGDEFLVVRRDLRDPADMLELAERIRATLGRAAEATPASVRLVAGIGVAVSKPGMDSDTLIAHADDAMYESKRLGGGQPVAYGGTTD
jgi:diguanylate cyclase (GGDEF)-like protein/PAS domain S-box-containing protein